MATIVMSLTSGAENMLFKGKEVEFLTNLLKCRSLPASHFKETETGKYLKLIKSDLTLTDVRSVSETNPYLFSHACEGVSYDNFAMLVDGLKLQVLNPFTYLWTFRFSKKLTKHHL